MESPGNSFRVPKTVSSRNFDQPTMASITLAAADIARVSSSASQILKAVAGSERNAALTAVYKHLEAAKDEILEANKRDMAAAEEQAVAGKLSRSMIKRLDLNNPGKWEEMLQGILDVRDLEDPGEEPLNL